MGTEELNFKYDGKIGHFSNMEMDMNSLMRQAENSHYLERILREAITHLYKSLPDGEEKYGDDGDIGSVYLTVWQSFRENRADVSYCPKGECKRKFTYISAPLGKIDLGEGTYIMRWHDGHSASYFQLPEVLIPDTETVMKILGLEKGEEKENIHYAMVRRGLSRQY